jgi:hypothetical protein
MAIYTCLIVLGGSAHEPWFDEAQAWLIAQGADPWTIVTRLVRYEGTPALWHLLLWLCQSLGVGYGALWLISGALACAAAWLVLYKSPFPLWLRAGLIFSYFSCYQYAVVARSYALDLLLLPFLAMLFKSRLERPLVYGALLGLLANTNAHSFVVTAPLALEFAWSAWSTRSVGGAALRRRAGGIALYAALAVAAVLQAWPPFDKDFASPGSSRISLLRPLILAPEAFIDRANLFGSDPPGFFFHLYADGYLLTLLVLAPIALLCWTAGRFWLFTGMMGALLFIYMLLYANYWHSGLLFMTATVCLWISWPHINEMRRDQRLWLMAALSILLCYNFVYSSLAWARDLTRPYSGSREAARVLKAIRVQHPAARIAAVGFKALAVIPILGENIFNNYKPTPSGGFYYRWTKNSDVPQYASPENWSGMLKSHAYDWILLSADSKNHDFEAGPYKVAAKNMRYCLSNEFQGELLWKMRVAEPDTLLLFQRCRDKAR